MVKGEGAGTPPALGTRGCGGPGAAAGVWQWGCDKPLRRPEMPYCWTGSAATEDAAWSLVDDLEDRKRNVNRLAEVTKWQVDFQYQTTRGVTVVSERNMRIKGRNKLRLDSGGYSRLWRSCKERGIFKLDNVSLIDLQNTAPKTIYPWNLGQ